MRSFSRNITMHSPTLTGDMSKDAQSHGASVAYSQSLRAYFPVKISAQKQWAQIAKANNHAHMWTQHCRQASWKAATIFNAFCHHFAIIHTLIVAPNTPGGRTRSPKQGGTRTQQRAC